MAVRTPWNRERVKRYLVQRFYTRFHMSMILSSSGLSAMLASWALLHAGEQSMLVRYPVAISVAYLAFLCGVWVWLRYVGLRGESGTGRSFLDAADFPDIPVGGGGGGSGGGAVGGLGKGGGTFDGGGASGSWLQGARPSAMPSNMQAQALAAASAPDTAGDSPSIATASGTGRSSSGSSFSLGDFGDLDGDAIVLLVLALAVIAAIFLASGYLVWFAPDILAEAAFGAMLAGGLSRRSRREDAGGWIAGVVKKTWWPFALVLVIAIAFAWHCANHYPQARTFKEAVTMALAS